MKRSEEIKRGPLFRAPGPRTQGSMRIEREKERERLATFCQWCSAEDCAPLRGNNYYYIIRVSRGSSVPRLRISIIFEACRENAPRTPRYVIIRPTASARYLWDRERDRSKSIRGFTWVPTDPPLFSIFLSFLALFLSSPGKEFFLANWWAELVCSVRTFFRRNGDFKIRSWNDYFLHWEEGGKKRWNY